MKITVVKKGTEVAEKSLRVYCGRGSPLGNPHIMKRDSTTERHRVCDLYEKEFPSPSQRSACETIVRRAAASGAREIELECFCAPKRCHCDTIKAFMLETYFPNLQQDS